MQRLWKDHTEATAQDWTSARELFFLRCRSKNVSDHTLAWYKTVLGGFLRFLEGVGAPTPRETTPNLVRAYLDHLRERGQSSVTINRTYGGLRCFFRYLSQERVIPATPFILIEKPKVEKKLIRPLNMVMAAKRSGYRPPSLGAIVHELVLGWLLNFGLLTWVQIRLARGAVWLFMTFDDWTCAASEWLIRPVAGRAPFAVNFLAALAAQLALVFGSLTVWTSAQLGPRILTALEAGLMRAFTSL